MPANSVLSGAEITNLSAGAHVAQSKLSHVPDTVVGTATVSATPTTSPIVQISVSGASAGWTSGRVGQTIKITSSDGTTLRGYFRLRSAAPTGSLIKIGAITDADAGLLSIGVRTSGIVAGDIITIYERYDLWSVAPRWDTTGTVYQDYDKVVSTLNTSPLPICNMSINGRAGDYCTEVANGASKAMSAVVSVTDNIGTLTYSWTVPASWTSVSGTNAATVTGNAPAGAYWLYCTITDATAGAQTIMRFVRIHTPADPAISCIITNDTRDRSWRSMTIRLPQSTVSAIPSKARCVVWGDSTWGGSDVASANRSFTGYVTSQPFSHEPAYHESSVEIVGTCGVLDSLKGYPAEFKYASSQTTWEELPSVRSTLQFIVRWLCRYRMANVMETFNHTPFTNSTSIARIKTYSVDPGSLYSQLKQVMDSYDVNVGSRSDGEIICAQHPSLLDDRSGVVSRATLSNSIYKSVEVQWIRAPKCGHFRLDGSWSDFTSKVKIAGDAPGKNQYGQGSAQRQSQNKIFESQSNCNQRVGDFYALENNEYPSITVDIPTNWDVFEPPDMQRVPITIPSGRSPTGVAITINSVPLSVTKNWLGGQKASIQLITEGETDGVDGETGDVPSEGSISIGDYGTYELPDFASPGWGDETGIDPVAANGSGLIFTSDGHVAKFDGVDFSDLSPNSDQRSSIGTGIKMLAKAWDYKSLILYGSLGALINGDHTVPTLSWQPTALSAFENQDSVQTRSYDFTTGAQGWTAYNDGAQTFGNLVAGNGWEDTYPTPGPNDGIYIISPVLTGVTAITKVVVTFSAAWTGINPKITITSATGLTTYFSTTDSGSTEITLTGTAATNQIMIIADPRVGSSQNFAGYITSVRLTANADTTGGGAQSEEFITDIQGSVNHDGYFCWLSKRTVSSVDYVYFNWTNDNFITRKSTQLARYVSGMGYSINLGSYGTPGALVVLASAGDPGTTDTGIYKSLDSGSSFSKITGTSLLYGGGAVVVPYQVAGAANASTTPTYGYIRGHNGGTVQFRSYSGATVNVAAGSVPVNGYVINSYTNDGDILAIPLTNQKVYRSPDGGDSWSIAGTVPGSGLLGMTGWPTNPDFYWAYGSDCLASTSDAGATWTDQRTDYETFASSEWGGDGQTIVSAFGDLHAFYSSEVVQ